MAQAESQIMTGQRIGYLRVSSVDQNEARQLEGQQLDRRFVDKASGKDTARPQLQEMLAYVRQGDTLVVHSIDRLARSLSDLLALVAKLSAKGVRVEFIKEGLTFSGDDSPMSKLTLQLMGAFAEFERTLIRERQAEGIAAAKARGERTGRPAKLSAEQVAEITRKAADGVPKAELARQFCVHRSTILSILKEAK